jgi:hypothetical protein
MRSTSKTRRVDFGDCESKELQAACFSRVPWLCGLQPGMPEQPTNMLEIMVLLVGL